MKAARRQRGPAHTFTPLKILDAQLSKGGRLLVTVPATHNALAVVAKGSLLAGGFKAGIGELVLFASDATRLELVADEDAHVIVLSGEPLNEPVCSTAPSS